jgi:hypothetical protein
MRHSLDLVKKLRARYPDKAERALALELGYSDTAFQSARQRGNLSPEMAADIAAMVGENPATWALVATAEAARHPGAKRRLTALLHGIV